MTLARLPQLDFSAGEFQGVAPHLIPENGAARMLNCLLDQDGSPYRRGGASYASPAFGGSGLTFVWAGFLAGGERVVVSSPSGLGVLREDGVFVNLGGSGLSAPVYAPELGGVLHVGTNLYAGSLKVRDYSKGLVNVTNGSPQVTGVGTSFLANVDKGMLFRVAAQGRYYVVQSVDSDTQITLTEPYQGATASSQSYALTRLGTVASSPYKLAGFYEVAGQRMCACVGNRIYTSEFDNPHVWPQDHYHELPGGVEILGARAIRDVLLVFTTDGVWTLSGLTFEPVDFHGNPQRRLERANPNMILWGNAGIAAWQNALLVPATDGLWLVDGASQPTMVSSSINGLWGRYVRSGFRPGLAAVHRGHYWLPVLNATATDVVDFMVCRLDRPVGIGGFGTVFPWTRWDGHAADVAALAARPPSSSRPPQLLAAGRTDGRVLDLDGCFHPDSSRKADADGSAFTWKFISRDIPTGGLVMNLVRRLWARYELHDAGRDDPVIQAAVGTDGRPEAAFFGSAHFGRDFFTDPEDAGFTGLEGDAPEDHGRNEMVWRVNKDARFMRVRLMSRNPAARLILRSFELVVRQRRARR